MEDFRSKSCGDMRMQIERYYGGSSRPTSYNLDDIRCYSASYAYSAEPTHMGKEVKFKKGKSTNGSSSKIWSITDPEFQRKRRVASYKVYSVEGKMKGTFRKSFRWIKEKCNQVVHGWW